MQRLLSLTAVCLISCAMALGQGTVTDQNPGSAPDAQGRAARTPSRPNQELTNKSNPANAAISEAGVNGQAVRPNTAKSGTPGTAAGNTPDNRDNNGMSKDDAGSNLASGRGANKLTNPGTSGTVQWFWTALGIILAVVLIGVLLSRNRAEANIDRNDPAVRLMRERKDADRRDERIRKAG
jgi:hypothetical protein